MFFSQLEALPDGLFSCKNLRTLLVSNNGLTVLSPLVGELVNLVYLELLSNQLEVLPMELSNCNLKQGGLVVEEVLFNTLPAAYREHLGKSEKDQV